MNLRKLLPARRAATAGSVSTLLPSPAPLAALRALALTALWIGLGLNLPTWWQRTQDVWASAPSAGLRWLGALGELGLVLGLCGLLLGLASVLGRIVLRSVGGALLLISAVCAYYMTRFNVVIGYGVINAVFTTDHDLSGEVVGVWMLLWLLAFGLVPAVLLWRKAPASWWVQRGWRGLATPLLALAGSAGVMGAGYGALNHVRQQIKATSTDAEINLVGVASHSYVPSNWIAGTGMVLGNEWTAWRNAKQLRSPAEQFHYTLDAPLNDAVVVLVIGETTRSDRMGLLGHDRDTTPHLRTDADVVALRGRSCDTATKLSLACMFVRPEGIRLSTGMEPDTILEDNVFAVYRKLGFHIELMALQSEAGFYARTHPHSYKLREVIAAQPEHAGKRLDDMLLVDELRAALARPVTGPRLIILHTKGSHYLYSQRYPREFARWTPDCLSTDAFCSGQELLNAFDNSVLFIDHTLHQMRQLLAGRKALLVYSPDHGESISDNTHFHATPRKIAPPEQRRIPLVFWASKPWQGNAVLAERFRRLQARAKTEQAVPLDQERVGHHNLFASLLGCAGISSKDGGITPADNLCH